VGSSVPPAVFYRYSPDRKGIHAEALLGGCRGFLHADGYAGFGRLYRPTTPAGEARLIEVACWSHFRRKLYDVHHATASPIALEALERIAALFAIESSVNGRAPDDRHAARAEHAAPLLDELKTFLDISLTKISGKSELAKAIRYALSRWKALVRYLGDGRLEMTNNAAERAMRIPVLGRKNYLFCGSDAGGQRAACLYTITATALCRARHNAVYADRRTMPSGAGRRRSFDHICGPLRDVRSNSIRHSSACYSASRNASRRSLG